MSTTTLTDEGRVQFYADKIISDHEGQGSDAPGSPFGTKIRNWAPTAAVLALVTARAGGSPDFDDELEAAVGLVVNGSDSVAYTLVNFEHELDGTVDVTDYLPDGERVSCPSCEAHNWKTYEDEVCTNCLAPLA